MECESSGPWSVSHSESVNCRTVIPTECGEAHWFRRTRHNVARHTVASSPWMKRVEGEVDLGTEYNLTEYEYTREQERKAKERLSSWTKGKKERRRAATHVTGSWPVTSFLGITSYFRFTITNQYVVSRWSSMRDITLLIHVYLHGFHDTTSEGPLIPMDIYHSSLDLWISTGPGPSRPC